MKTFYMILFIMTSDMKTQKFRLNLVKSLEFHKLINELWK